MCLVATHRKGVDLPGGRAVKRVTRLTPDRGGSAVIEERGLLDHKFRVPATGADVVHRDRLTALIERATERPVTVVTAPPGAGKTIACAGWAAVRGRSRRIA